MNANGALIFSCVHTRLHDCVSHRGELLRHGHGQSLVLMLHVLGLLDGMGLLQARLSAHNGSCSCE